MSTEEQQREQKENLLDLSDDMAEAATEFEGQGYRLFLNARERLKEALEKLLK